MYPGWYFWATAPILVLYLASSRTRAVARRSRALITYRLMPGNNKGGGGRGG